MAIGKKIISICVGLLLSMTMVSCNSGNNGGGGGPVVVVPPQVEKLFVEPNVTADAFVDSLNYIDGNLDSYVELYDTFREIDEGIDNWFVIWDDFYGEYKAVSLQYIRSIEYWDYVKNTDSLADEFRAIESDDIAAGELEGDFFGDDYEVVDYFENDDVFVGRNSGWEYEDEDQTSDVNLMAAKIAQKKFLTLASAVSYEFKVNISTAMGLVTLGDKMASMKSKGDLSSEDQLALSGDLQKLTGITLKDLTSESKDAIFAKAAKNLGTSAVNLEQKLLPEVFGIEL